MNEIYSICKSVMKCIVTDEYQILEEQQALVRVPKEAIKRVLSEYNPKEKPVMPPDDYFEKAADIYRYTDGSGYHVDINLWYAFGESDLTLQLDIRKRAGQLSFIIDDLHVL